MVDTCNITLIQFLKCGVTKFRIPPLSCHTMSHFVDPLRPLNVWHNLWMSPYFTTHIYACWYLRSQCPEEARQLSWSYGGWDNCGMYLSKFLLQSIKHKNINSEFNLNVVQLVLAAWKKVILCSSAMINV